MKRKFLFSYLFLACVITLIAQDKMFLFKSDKMVLGAPINAIDSLTFSKDGTTALLVVNGTPASFPVSTLDSITFGNSTDTISINYNGSSVNVVNPLYFEGVNVAVSGADVTVTSSSLTKDITYRLSGTTNEGMFKVYSAHAFNILLNGVSITNTNGPAINNQSSKATNVILADGSVNTLTDGPTYAAATVVNGIAEDQGAAFFSEGQLIFSGTGKLTINGKGTLQHGLNSDDFIQINNGTIQVTSAAKDGIHGNDGFIMSNGTVTVNSNSDGIDGGPGYVKISGGSITVVNQYPNVNSICCDSTMTISGGAITATVNGNQSKGLKSTQAMALNGGDIHITAAGGVVKTVLGLGFDPSYCTGIKSDASITVNGATISILHSGEAGKGISTATDFTMNSGTLSIYTNGAGALYTNNLGVIDAYSATCISTNGRVDLLGGNITLTSTGTGGKGISADGILTIGSETGTPTVTASTSGASILNGTTSVTEAKALKSDDDIYLLNGTVLVNNTGAGEGIDTKKTLHMDGGTVVVQGSAVAKTKSVDYGTAFNITGGTLMVSGPIRTTIPIPTASTSTQRFLYSTTTATVAAGTLFHIQDAAATNLVTYKPTRAAYYFIFSSPNLKANTAYSIYTGGSTTGTSLNGLYTGGIYTPGTLKANYGTTANSITF
jgi:trimeric autotransporter adhesin